MKIAYFDCFSGISGDMVLGALVGAGCDLEQLEAHLRQLPLTGWNIAGTRVTRNGLGGYARDCGVRRVPPSPVARGPSLN